MKTTFEDADQLYGAAADLMNTFAFDEVKGELDAIRTRLEAELYAAAKKFVAQYEVKS